MKKLLMTFGGGSPQRGAVPIMILAGLLIPWQASGQNANANPYVAPHRDQKIELAMKIKQPFTLAAVGDMIQIFPFSKYNDPAIQSLLSIMRGADMTTANMEAQIIDFDHYTGPRGANLAVKEVADDLAAMGIKMMTKANNHTFGSGMEGWLENFRQLERVGIVQAGVGKTIQEARLPRYYETPKGRVGFVGLYTEGGTGRGGATGINYVTAAQLAQLRAIRDSIVARRGEVTNPIELPPPDEEGTASVFGATFKIGPRPAGATDGAGAANAAQGGRGGRGGRGAAGAMPITAVTNSLRVTQYNGVTAEQMAQLRAIHESEGAGAVASPSTARPDALSAFGLLFHVSPKPGEYSYDMNAQDEKEILQGVRTGKQSSDFMIATIHWHQNTVAFQHYSFDHYPPDYEIKFAHDVIDAGADAFIGHGVHTLKGVEIYHGKPIFYGVSNFVFQSQAMPAADNAAPEPILGLGEANETRWAWLQKPDNFEALLTYSHYENGQLAEVRIYPADLGLNLPGSQMGTPRKPTPEVAKKILDKVATYSKPFGTKISIENGVGYIRIPPNERSPAN